ncbi:heterokaryon incompatibility protein-domain-containing protein [Trametes meyenii]|nr:heterokaryon incompatibility protein-domain-containing protein [Trametes meyenii]
MWLLDTHTHEICSFLLECDRPPYAILSHCWLRPNESEVTFSDVQHWSPLRRVQANDGWKKIKGACRAARKMGWKWIWIDTCCIDKSSSAELSEAIRSMFAWYRDAQVCLVYLNDVPGSEHKEVVDQCLRNSRWFKRGWTLQELVASQLDMVFLDQEWRSIGTREELADIIHEITGVDRWVLKVIPEQSNSSDFTGDAGIQAQLKITKRVKSIHALSIAKRMSWARGRETGRPEDRAYSLMGIFGVSMPVLYGEGGVEAFRRLQLEICRRSPDHTLFAHGIHLSLLSNPFSGPGPQGRLKTASVLAMSPDSFCSPIAFKPITMLRLTRKLKLATIEDPHYHDTNFGVRIQLPIACIDTGLRLHCALLGVMPLSDSDDRIIGLLLWQRESGPNLYRRLALYEDSPTIPTGTSTLHQSEPSSTPTTLPTCPKPPALAASHGFGITSSTQAIPSAFKTHVLVDTSTFLENDMENSPTLAGLTWEVKTIYIAI